MAKDTYIFQIPPSDFHHLRGAGEEKNADQLAHTHFVPANSVDDALLSMTFHVTALSLSWD